METVVAILMLGVAVTLVVLKGLVQARDFAKAELEKLDKPARDDVGEN